MWKPPQTESVQSVQSRYVGGGPPNGLGFSNCRNAGAFSQAGVINSGTEIVLVPICAGFSFVAM